MCLSFPMFGSNVTIIFQRGIQFICTRPYEIPFKLSTEHALQTFKIVLYPHITHLWFNFLSIYLNIEFPSFIFLRWNIMTLSRRINFCQYDVGTSAADE